MTPSLLLQTAIIPALAYLGKDSPEARRFLIAIALQESGLKHRRQVVDGQEEAGPAVSWWQFERGGGCRGVLTHSAAAPLMRQVCGDFNVVPTEYGLWEAMRYHDIVAAAAARLLIFTLPAKLPTSAEEGWKQYLSAWRPGRPHPETWAGHWEAAGQTIKGA